MSNQDQGREYEKQIAAEFGLNLVPGSGSQWFAKLDSYGKGFRASIKWTSKESYRVTKKDIDELIEVATGVGGTGEIPIWVLHFNEQDFVLLRKQDFLSWSKGEISIEKEQRAGTAKRSARADIPVLLRE